MKRACQAFLNNWLHSPSRKPLVLRGARQVGKTWLVRHLAKTANLQLIEINLEKKPQLTSLFNSNDPKKILIELEATYEKQIIPNQFLLFLDEIQATPELLATLRWFAEDLPELAVIAAGSLLEFVLAEHTFSMPVGRISYMHVEPLSFEEFIVAKEKPLLQNYLANYHESSEIPIATHEQLLQLFREYIIVGGMPAVVSNWVTTQSLLAVQQTQHDLLTTFRDDFVKYSQKIDSRYIDEIMMAVPKMLGKKIIYSQISPMLQANISKQIFRLLNKARVCHSIYSCYANGVPLAAEIREKFFKEIFLDTGLACAALGLGLNQISNAQDISLINNGGIAEQVAGQLLRTIEAPYIEPALYYWHREEKGSNAEVDYILQHANQVIPIEIKSGSTGGLKSLHLLMGEKKLPLGLRINSDLPSKTPVKIKDHAGKEISYTLLSLPFYLLGQIHRLIDETDKNQ